jgi:hypothetical protein
MNIKADTLLRRFVPALAILVSALAARPAAAQG